MERLGPRIGRGSSKGWQSLAALLVVLTVAACAARGPGSAANTAPPPPDFRQLAGMSAADLQRALGEPDFRRNEPPAEVWQYRGNTCVLDVFLYRSGDTYRVVYAETHDRDTIRVSQANCYAALFPHHGHEA